MTKKTHRIRWTLIGALSFVVVVGFGGPVIYNNYIAGPVTAKLSLPQSEPSSPSKVALSNGTWNVGGNSVAGYRAQVDALGYHTTLIGRTKKITGSVTIVGSTIAQASFAVRLSSLSGSNQMDTIMSVSKFPTATFSLTSPVNFKSPPSDGTTMQGAAAGMLTLRGESKVVTFALADKRIGNKVFVLAEIPIDSNKWNIADPIGVESPATLEVRLSLTNGSASPGASI